MIPKKRSEYFKEVQNETREKTLQKKRMTASHNKITVEDPAIDRDTKVVIETDEENDLITPENAEKLAAEDRERKKWQSGLQQILKEAGKDKKKATSEILDAGELRTQVQKHIANFFTCQIHPGKAVEFIKLDSHHNVSSLVCSFCLLKMNDSERKCLIEITEQLNKIIRSYASIQPQKTISEVNNVNLPDEYMQKLQTEVDAEKATLIRFSEAVKERLVHQLEEKKNIALKSLDDYVANVRVRISILHSNLKRLKSGISEYHTSGWDSLLKKIQKLQNTSEFENLLITYNQDIQENESLKEKGSKEAIKAIQSSFDEIKKAFEKREKGDKIQPLTNISSLSDFEKSLSEWTTKLSQVVSDLSISVQSPDSFFTEKNFDSLILKGKGEFNLIKGWLGSKPTLHSNIKLNLLYRGSVDGFNTTEFHRKCDFRGPTITIVESAQNRRFGGYCPVDWKSVGGWVHHTQSFLFSLDDKKKLPGIHNAGYDLYFDKTYGPTFGCKRTRNYNLAIYNSYSYSKHKDYLYSKHEDSTPEDSYSEPEDYSNSKHKDYSYSKHKDSCSKLAGEICGIVEMDEEEDETFAVKEIEVFTVKFLP